MGTAEEVQKLPNPSNLEIIAKRKLSTPQATKYDWKGMINGQKLQDQVDEDLCRGSRGQQQGVLWMGAEEP